MGLLKEATNSTAFVKAGVMGFAGSGKTFTAANIAIGLAKLEKAKQIAFFDTEKGSDFIVKRAKGAGMKLMAHKSRSFVDLITIIDECEKEKIPVLIIDSISHVWRELCDSYQKKNHKKFLGMPDWGILKGQWKEYTDRYINSKVHIIMCGRAGYEYDQGVNEDTGKKEITKTGTKMKVEGETGFEPDLLLEMERISDDEKGIINRCWVLKDRSNLMNGKSFDYPTFETFKPFVEFLNIGGKHEGVDVTRNSAELFDSPDRSFEQMCKRRDIALEELKAILIKGGLDGTSAEAKLGRTKLLEKVFGQSSWTYIENLRPEMIERSLVTMRDELKQAPPEAPKK